MKKLLAFIAIFGALTFGLANNLSAQDGGETITEEVTDAAGEMVDEAGDAMEAGADSAAAAAQKAAANLQNRAQAAKEALEADAADAPAEKREVLSFHQTVKRYFIEGGATFMAFVLICLIFGLALAIERIIYLNMATTNTDKLLAKVEDALKAGGAEAAKEVCRNTRGPVASIFYQGLDRYDGDFQEMVKAIEDNGSVEMSKLESGLSWISLFIALAPMLGFMGTVIGMISAFDKIAEANTINASIVAGGIKVALITTVSGLIVAIILQIFYNYILSKIDSLVLDMEESSMELVDMLYKMRRSK
ncbi:MotA/TolQ/ExbB proton channel family protein [Sanyastnella coralliicola]|uniref:MotA/TolQ/ExbB proton channel family protein n=1 Tax=Sanyastnella coralliicola TaxID=3069118 RepID=UPI0027B9A173|nr:MotA/TolQ/ExbB proton channel family protein [Longitalea sp. SCSIO 12813]